MKTDLVEIFQTIRAGLQPFSNRGYTAQQNTDEAFDLFSEKNIEEGDTKITERFLCGVYIEEQAVEVKMNAKDFDSSNQEPVKFDGDFSGFSVEELDDAKLQDILLQIEITHTKFKENGWI